MPRRSQENYFDDFWLDLVKNDARDHGLRTPNEGINQRYMKNWTDVADKICFGSI